MRTPKKTSPLKARKLAGRKSRQSAVRKPRGSATPKPAVSEGAGVYSRIYDVVRLIPPGRVASYGQIAAIVKGCTPRMVGYAMSAMPFWEDAPWQRVINSRGEVSPRCHGEGDVTQRQLLEAEGVVFDARGRIDLDQYGWDGTVRRRRG